MQSDPASPTRDEGETAFSQQFLAFDYPETKDLCKQFLTLLSGLLVFSVTFAEKFVGHSRLPFRLLLVASWFLFLFAIIGTGAGLYLIFVAGQHATHSPAKGARRNLPWRYSFLALNLSGISFVIGLLLLIISGIAGVL